MLRPNLLCFVIDSKSFVLVNQLLHPINSEKLDSFGIILILVLTILLVVLLLMSDLFIYSFKLVGFI